VIYISYDHHSPALAGIIDACCCLSTYIIVSVVKMVNKKNVKDYLKTGTEKLRSSRGVHHYNYQRLSATPIPIAIGMRRPLCGWGDPSLISLHNKWNVPTEASGRDQINLKSKGL